MKCWGFIMIRKKEMLTKRNWFTVIAKIVTAQKIVAIIAEYFVIVITEAFTATVNIITAITITVTRK